MRNKDTRFWRAALWMHDLYVKKKREEQVGAISGLETAIRPYLDQALRHEQLAQKALARGFQFATKRLTSRYLRTLEDVTSALDWHTKQARQEIPAPPSLPTLLEEIAACEDEFDVLDVCRDDQRVSVTTESIMLEGVPLGRFRIDLLPSNMPDKDPLDWFRIEALDPNPSAPNENVPHPHVDGDHLCTGDGSTAIHGALIAGRLSEFFVLVRSILRTYNPESPYVSIEDWDGRPCEDCGYTASEDNAFYCEGCENTFCDECVRSCETCDVTLCRGCLHRSEISGVWVCESCAGQCAGCSRWCTTEEMTDGLCENCQETQNDEETSHETDSETEDETHQAQSAAIAGE